MRILIAHNYYQRPGGEDEVFSREAAILEANGHEVTRFTVNNESIGRRNLLPTAVRAIWNSAAYSQLRQMLSHGAYDICHFVNTFPLISPSAYYAARSAGAAVVQSVQNYRLICPSGNLFRSGEVCEDCCGRKFAWPGVARGCFHGSRLGSASIAALNTVHWRLGTWTKVVDAFVAPTEFVRRKLIQAGLPQDRIHVKPNPVYPDPGPGRGSGNYALYVGRLTPEKGLPVLVEAWRRLKIPLPLKIAGTGPLEATLRTAFVNMPWVEILGHVDKPQCLQLMKDAKFLVFPSIWYEPYGLVVAEAAATGTPVVACRTGAAQELITNGQTGVLFDPADLSDLAMKVDRLLRVPGLLAEMRGRIRAAFEARCTAAANHQLLETIFKAAIRRRALSSRAKIRPHPEAA